MSLVTPTLVALWCHMVPFPQPNASFSFQIRTWKQKCAPGLKLGDNLCILCIQTVFSMYYQLLFCQLLYSTFFGFRNCFYWAYQMMKWRHKRASFIKTYFSVLYFLFFYIIFILFICFPRSRYIFYPTYWKVTLLP